jgi:predicted AAA+ superfamily ATPase
VGLAPEFFLFDTGVVRALNGTLNVELVPGTYAFGKAFEHFVLLEIVRLSDYRRNDYRFFYLRTKDGAEIDLIIERPGCPTALVEIKSADRVGVRDTRDVSRFLPDFQGAEAFCLSRDQVRKRLGDVLAVPWQEGLNELGL